MLSQRSRYALKALVRLARTADGEPVQIASLAESEDIPRKFLEIILVELKRQNLVQSLRGKRGGYKLARPPEEITFGEIIRITDGPLALVPCVSRTAYRRCEDCKDEAACAINRVMAVVRDETARILDATTLADVLNGDGTAFLPEVAPAENADEDADAPTPGAAPRAAAALAHGAHPAE